MKDCHSANKSFTALSSISSFASLSLELFGVISKISLTINAWRFLSIILFWCLSYHPNLFNLSIEHLLFLTSDAMSYKPAKVSSVVSLSLKSTDCYKQVNFNTNSIYLNTCNPVCSILKRWALMQLRSVS